MAPPAGQDPHHLRGGGGAGRLGLGGRGNDFKHGGRGGGSGPSASNRPKRKKILDSVRLLFFGLPTFGKRESMSDYIKSKTSIIEIPVPGDTRSYMKRSEPARLTTCALVNWFCDLHDLGYSLNGNFTAIDFDIDQLGFLKGVNSLLYKLTELIEDRDSKLSYDMAAAAAIIETIHHTVANTAFPEDLGYLIKCLKTYDEKYSHLVRKHACHEVEAVKCSLIVKMYDRLKVIQGTNNTVHSRIMQKIPDGSVWISHALQNPHLHSVLRFSDT